MEAHLSLVSWIFLCFLDFLEFFQNFFEDLEDFGKNRGKGKVLEVQGRPRSREFLEIVFVFLFLFFLEKYSEKFYENCKNLDGAGMFVGSATNLQGRRLFLPDA